MREEVRMRGLQSIRVLKLSTGHNQERGEVPCAKETVNINYFCSFIYFSSDFI